MKLVKGKILKYPSDQKKYPNKYFDEPVDTGVFKISLQAK